MQLQQLLFKWQKFGIHLICFHELGQLFNFDQSHRKVESHWLCQSQQLCLQIHIYLYSKVNHLLQENQLNRDRWLCSQQVGADWDYVLLLLQRLMSSYQQLERGLDYQHLMHLRRPVNLFLTILGSLKPQLINLTNNFHTLWSRTLSITQQVLLFIQFQFALWLSNHHHTLLFSLLTQFRVINKRHIHLHIPVLYLEVISAHFVCF